MMCITCALLFGCGSDERAPVKTPPPKPLVEEVRQPARIAAIGNTSQLSLELQRAFDPAGDYQPMGQSDWLEAHPETPQTFAQFLNADTHVPSGRRRILYLLPIGEFPSSAPPLPALAKIVRAFYQIDVQMLPSVKLSEVKVKTRIHDVTKKRQLLAPEVLAWLTKRLPDDAFGLMAITMEDLYPQESWNFVFGMASLRERVGVQSFARQDSAFFGEARDPGWEKLALRRATWTLVHEIAHMFGLPHCTYWECVVAGSNNQMEADNRPLHPCPVCLRKLHSSIDFDPAVRETDLANVLGELGIDDEAAWSERRAKWIREGTR